MQAAPPRSTPRVGTRRRRPLPGARPPGLRQWGSRGTDMAVSNLPSGQPVMQVTGWAKERLEQMTPEGHTAVIHSHPDRRSSLGAGLCGDRGAARCCRGAAPAGRPGLAPQDQLRDQRRRLFRVRRRLAYSVGIRISAAARADDRVDARRPQRQPEQRPDEEQRKDRAEGRSAPRAGCRLCVQPHFSNSTATMPAIISEPKEREQDHVLFSQHHTRRDARAPQIRFGRHARLALGLQLGDLHRALPRRRWSARPAPCRGGALPLASRQRKQLDPLAPDASSRAPGKGERPRICLSIWGAGWVQSTRASALSGGIFSA